LCTMSAAFRQLKKMILLYLTITMRSVVWRFYWWCIFDGKVTTLDLADYTQKKKDLF
jgi:hypothetical protein